MKALIEQLQQLPGNAPSFIAIDGAGGSGKTSLANFLASELSDCDVISLDHFYIRSIEVEKSLRLPYDYERLCTQLLFPLASGSTARYALYSWEHDAWLSEREISPRQLIFVEGVSTMHPLLRQYFRYNIFVECPETLRWRRLQARDGVSSEEWWRKVWLPREQHYFKEHCPKNRADAIVESTANGFTVQFSG